MSDITENERTLALACTMIEVLQERHALSRDEMTLVCSLALEVNLKAEAGNPDAAAIVVHATEHLRGIMRGVIEARRAKLDPDNLN